MAAYAIFFFFLLVSPILSSFASPTQFLDVAASLRLTRQVFSPPPTPTTTAAAPNSTLSLSLHPLSSFPDLLSMHNQNYTSLTLFRLAADQTRLHSILTSINPTYKPNAQFQSPVISGVRQGSGEYFARIGFGTPIRQQYMVLDTGSDINWFQCQPCSPCYQQTDPVFNPAASSTYRPLSCNSPLCSSLHVSGCQTQTGSCLYRVDYGDGSHTVGNFATDTVTFGTTGSVPGVAVGCGHDNEGLFSGSAGLLGLGSGSLSLPSQVKATSFSYCLVNRDSSGSSTLEFNTVQPPDSIEAPLLSNALVGTYRYVDFTGIDVGGRPVPIPEALFQIGGDGRGGVIVDSGTAVTRLRSDVYNIFRDSFKSMSQNLPEASGFSLFDTCYDLSSMTRVSVPTVAFRFSGGKRLQLPPSNYLIPVSSGGKFCFAFAGTEGSLSIIGNVQQQGTRVSYNLANKYVAFSPNKC